MLRVPAVNMDFNKDGTVGNNTLQTLYDQLVKPEIQRIKTFERLQEQGELENFLGENYMKGWNKFYLLPQMQDILMRNGKIRSDAMEQSVIENEIKPKIREVLEGNETTGEKGLIGKQLSLWDGYEIGKTEKNDNGKITQQHKYLSKTFLREQVQNVSEENLDRAAAADMVVQYLVSNANVTMTFTGDPAQYAKGDGNIEATYENIGKRLAADVAPGEEFNGIHEKNINYSIIRDKKAQSRNLEEIKKLFGQSEGYDSIDATDAQEIATMSHYLELQAMEGVLDPDLVNKINGIIKKQVEERGNFNYMKNIKNGLTQAEYSKFKEVVFNPQKPVYVENKPEPVGDNNIESRYYIKSSVYPLVPNETTGKHIDKLRMAMEAEKIDRIAFETAAKLHNVPENNTGEIFDEQTGELKDFDSLKEELGKSWVELPGRGLRKQQEVPYKKDTKEINRITQVGKNSFTDLMHITGFQYNSQEMSGKELYNHYMDNYKKLFHETKKELFKTLGIEYYQDEESGEVIAGDLSQFDKEAVRRMLLRQAEDRGYSINAFQHIDFDTELTNLSFTPVQFEALLNSIVNNNVVKTKMPGRAYVVASEEGFSDMSQQEMEEVYGENWKEVVSENSEIIYTDKWDGELKHNQVFLPWNFYDNSGNKLNPSDYMYIGEDGKKYLDTKNKHIDSDLLKVFAMRIPNQGLNFQASLEIAGFLPPSAGDKIIPSRDLTIKMGQDFDVDKLYTYQPYQFIDENGNIRKVDQKAREELENEFEEGLDQAMEDMAEYSNVAKRVLNELNSQIADQQTDIDTRSEFGFSVRGAIQVIKDLKNKKSVEQDALRQAMAAYKLLKKVSNEQNHLKNNIIDIHHAIHENSNEEVQKRIFKSEDSGFLAEARDKIKEAQGTEPNFVPLSAQYQFDKRNSAKSAKSGVGIYANDLILNSLLQTSENQVFLHFGRTKSGDPIPMRVNIGGKRSEGILNPENGETLDGKKKISDVISKFLTANVDHENEQIINWINLNEHTSPFVKVLNQLGYSELTPYLISQPIIKDLVSEIERLQASDEFVSNAEEQALQNIKAKYTSKKYEDKVEKAGSKGLMDISNEYTSKLSKEELLNMIKNKGVENYNEKQRAILEKYTLLKPFGRQLARIQSLINSDSQGFGKNVFESLQKEQELNDVAIINNIENITDVFDSNTIPGQVIENGLSVNNQLWKNLVFYNQFAIQNIFETAETLFQKEFIGHTQRAEFRQQLTEQMKSFLFTDPNLGLFDNPYGERERLFFGNESDKPLGRKVLALQEAGIKNPFIQSLQIEPGNKKHLPTKVEFLASSMEEEANKDFMEDFLNMIVNPRDIKTSLGTYNTRDIAEDLIRYAYLEGGLQKAKQFVRYIPASYLYSTPFANRISKIVGEDRILADGKILGTNNTDMRDWTTLPPFLIQYGQHFPKELPKVEPEQTNHPNNTPQNIKEFKLNNKDTWIDENTPAPMLAMRNNNAPKGLKNWNVYVRTNMENGQPVYTEVGPRGVFGMNEYNITVPKGNVSKSLVYRTNRKQPEQQQKTRNQYQNGDSTGHVNPRKQPEALDVESGNIDKVLSQINETTEDPFFREVSKMLMNNKNNLAEGIINIEVDNNMSALGKWKPSNRTIYINRKAIGQNKHLMEQAILHETLHSVLNHAIRHSKHYSKKVQRNVESLNKLREEFKEKFKQDLSQEEKARMEELEKFFNENGHMSGVATKEEFSKYYGLFSTYEFMTMTMTDKGFQEQLNNKLRKKEVNFLDSVFEKLKQILSEVFGANFNENSFLTAALDDVMRLVESVGDRQVRESTEQTQEQKNLKGYDTNTGKNPLDFGNLDPNDISDLPAFVPEPKTILNDFGLIKNNGEKMTFKPDTRGGVEQWNRVIKKAQRINNGQVEQYGAQYYEAVPGKTYINGRERYTVTLRPVEQINNLQGRMELVTDKQVEEQMKKC